MREPVEGTVDGVAYIFMPLAPSIALKLIARIGKTILGPLGALFGKVKSIKALLDMKLDADLSQFDLPKTFEALSNNLNEDEFEKTVRQLVENQVLDATKTTIQYELYFQEKGPIHLLKVARKSFEVNFGDFFAVLKEKMPNTT